MPNPLRKGQKIIRFEDGDETIAVLVTLEPNGEYSAIDHENYDYDSPVGWGVSNIGAIADLFAKLPRAASDREGRMSDRAGFAADHAADYRKHSETV